MQESATVRGMIVLSGLPSNDASALRTEENVKLFYDVGNTEIFLTDATGKYPVDCVLELSTQISTIIKRCSRKP